jgi:hypothetical protein
MTLRIYTTSVIGGCFDPEFQVPSSRLVEKLKPLLELLDAPEKARDVLKAIPGGTKMKTGKGWRLMSPPKNEAFKAVLLGTLDHAGERLAIFKVISPPEKAH